MQIDTMSHPLYFSYDARSEYPYVMVCKKYPMTGFSLYTDTIKSMAQFDSIQNKGYAMLFDLYLLNIECYEHVTVPYIPFSKVQDVSGKYSLDNGRVLSAQYLKLTCTEIDFDIIVRQYKIGKKAIKNLYVSEYSYLPTPIVNHVRDGFYTKCGFEERGEKGTYYYDRTKNELNGNFGMMYTDPVREEVILHEKLVDGKRWKTQTPDIESALAKFYNSRNSFLCYQWGVWTTAHARYHHQKLIDAFGEEFIYGDTDSAKGTDIDGSVEQRVTKINSEIEAECIPRKAYYDMKNGTRLYMGVFVKEASMIEFKTLGAKKYAYVDDSGELHVTVSGVVKKNSKGITSAQELGDISNFDLNMTWSECGGLEARYHDLDKPVTAILKDEYGKPHKVTYGSNISMVDSTYTLGVGNDYGALLKMLKNIDKNRK